MKKTNLISLIVMLLISGTLFSQSQPKAETMFLIKTDLGNIVCKLYNDTPGHRDNFIKLVNEGWYEGSDFHRVIKGFMIQAGADADGTQDPGYTVPAEFRTEHFHKRGVIAAARMGDQVNPKKNSSGCQFYIVQGRRFPGEELSAIEARMGVKFSDEQRKAYTTLGGSPHLDGEYTVFGEVLSGMDVVDAIANVPTQKGDKPVDRIGMSIEIIE